MSTTKSHKIERRSFVAKLLASVPDALVVTGLGSATYDVFAAGDRDTNYYLWGAMGGSTSLGLGLALAQPEKSVLIITGDGEQLMGIGSLATIAVKQPRNLTIVVLDNGHFGETGMWAGGRLEFLRPLRVGEAVSRTSRIVDVSSKEGRTGPLGFVLVRHEVAGAEGVALIEEQDIVYRENSRPGDPTPTPLAAPKEHDWAREIRPDPVLLFRYSALTFNGHRIHYDRRYVTEVEGYPGLVVHGPLIATLLLDLLRRSLPDVTVSRFSFRAIKPMFDVAPFSVCGRRESDGKSVKLWGRDAEGWLTMDATATIS